jgi:(heptosyl)LPS beta-1,4-glucosyltransferase
MIDADEVVEGGLAVELKSFAKDIYLDGVNIPRKNHIFGKWIRHADWYPDYRLVFVRPKIARYSGDVHERISFTKGNGNVATSTSAIVHHNYDSVREFVVKNMVDYPLQYAKVLDSQGTKFNPLDMLTKPIGEFMRRYFLTEGYKDGMYGLVLSLLMGAQTLIAYVYLWEMQGKPEDLSTTESKELFSALRKTGSELSYWLTTMAIDSSTGAIKYLHKARRKALKVIRGI